MTMPAPLGPQPVYPMSRGAEVLRKQMNQFLRTAVPFYLAAFRNEWGQEVWQLPDFVMYDLYDATLVSNGEYPGLAVYVGNSRDHVRVDVHDGGAQEYKPTYQVRVLIAARSPVNEEGEWQEPEKEQAMRLCNDLTTAVRNCMLQTPSFGRPDIIEMNEPTMTTDYLDPMMPNTQSKRWVAMSVTTVDVRMTEYTFALPYGDAQQLITELQKLNP